MKPPSFVGSSLDDLRDFPAAVRHAIGIEMMRVQFGGVPTDFKPLKEVGSGACGIRVSVDGAWRVIYVARREKKICVLHAFQKKTRKTARSDIESAAKRYRLIGG